MTTVSLGKNAGTSDPKREHCNRLLFLEIYIRAQNVLPLRAL
jgi:hypothetical protein